MKTKSILLGAVATLIAAGSGVGLAIAQQTGDAPAITEAQAIEIALAEVPGEVRETELEREDGMQVYEIEIRTADGAEMEVAVDASNGTVLEVEADDADDGDDADDDDSDDDDGEDDDEKSSD